MKTPRKQLDAVAVKNLAVARLVLAKPEKFDVRLLEWAKRVIEEMRKGGRT